MVEVGVKTGILQRGAVVVYSVKQNRGLGKVRKGRVQGGLGHGRKEQGRLQGRAG